MHETAHLRRQAGLCLRLVQFCPDQPVSRHLSFLAAHYHEVALRAEFGMSADHHAPNGFVGRAGSSAAGSALRTIRGIGPLELSTN
jgi:hypothetical protein